MKIKVKVIPKSSENSLEYDRNQELYKAKVVVAPEKGKANEKVAELIADYFDTNKNSVQLLSGASSNIKLFEITDE